MHDVCSATGTHLLIRMPYNQATIYMCIVFVTHEKPFVGFTLSVMAPTLRAQVPFPAPDEILLAVQWHATHKEILNKEQHA